MLEYLFPVLGYWNGICLYICFISTLFNVGLYVEISIILTGLLEKYTCKFTLLFYNHGLHRLLYMIDYMITYSFILLGYYNHPNDSFR